MLNLGMRLYSAVSKPEKMRFKFKKAVFSMFYSQLKSACRGWQRALLKTKRFPVRYIKMGSTNRGLAGGLGAFFQRSNESS